MDSVTNLNAVLLINNNESSCFTIIKILENNGVKKTSTFKNAPSALTYLLKTKEKYQLILVDIDLPLMDGFTFLKEYTSSINTKKHGKVCLLSNAINSTEIYEAKFHNANLIEKPFTFEKIKHLK